MSGASLRALLCSYEGADAERCAHRLWAILTEGLLLGMTMRKFVRSVREGWAHMSLVRLLVLDGLWAFIVIFCSRSPRRAVSAPLTAAQSHS
jgi:hypothetical protein